MFYTLIKHGFLTNQSARRVLSIKRLLYGQDEPNRPLLLATRAGKIEPSCPFGTTRCIPQAKFNLKPYNKSFIDQVCLFKMAKYLPHSFFAPSVHKHAKKELGQYPAILISHLVNPYLVTNVKSRWLAAGYFASFLPVYQ